MQIKQNVLNALFLTFVNEQLFIQEHSKQKEDEIKISVHKNNCKKLCFASKNIDNYRSTLKVNDYWIKFIVFFAFLRKS